MLNLSLWSIFNEGVVVRSVVYQYAIKIFIISLSRCRSLSCRPPSPLPHPQTFLLRLPYVSLSLSLQEKERIVYYRFRAATYPTKDAIHSVLPRITDREFPSVLFPGVIFRTPNSPHSGKHERNIRLTRIQEETCCT